MHDLINQLLAWYDEALKHNGYLVIALLMAMESTIVPIPSELIIAPAAIIAARTGNLSYAGIVIAGALGSWAGATIMYWASRWAGRPLVLKYGKYVLVSPQKVEQAEIWAAQFGSFGVFVSRLIPVVRHLIGIPAGIVRMNYVKFSLFTLLGAGLWSAVLCWVGVKANADDQLMKGEITHVLIWLLGGLAVIGALYYFFVHRLTRHAAKKA